MFRKTEFVQRTTDLCLFVKRTKRALVFVVMYVDDLLVGCLLEEDGDVRQKLAEFFTAKALGDVRFVLGIRVQYNKDKGCYGWDKSNLSSEVESLVRKTLSMYAINLYLAKNCMFKTTQLLRV